MTRTSILSAAVVLLALAAPARAIEPPAHDRASVRAGTFIPQQPAGIFDGGPDVAIAYGRDFYSFLSGELSAGFATARSLPWRLVYPGEQYITGSSQVTFRVLPVALTARLVLPTGNVRPYLLAGGGLALATVVLDPAEEEKATLTETRVAGELHAGFGFTVSVTRAVFAGVEGRYDVLNTLAHGQRFHLGGIRAGLTLGMEL